MNKAAEECFEWPILPAYPFVWRCRSQAEVQGAAYPTEVGADDDAALAALFRCDAVRDTPLSHWPGTRLVQLGFRDRAGAQPRVMSFVHLGTSQPQQQRWMPPSSALGYIALGGSPDTFADISRSCGIRLTDRSAALDYLACFVAFALDRSGSVQLLTPDSMLVRTWPAERRRLVAAPVLLRSDADQCHVFEVHLLYEGELSRAVVEVRSDRIELLEDTRLEDGAAAQDAAGAPARDAVARAEQRTGARPQQRPDGRHAQRKDCCDLPAPACEEKENTDLTRESATGLPAWPRVARDAYAAVMRARVLHSERPTNTPADCAMPARLGRAGGGTAAAAGSVAADAAMQPRFIEVEVISRQDVEALRRRTVREAEIDSKTRHRDLVEQLSRLGTTRRLVCAGPRTRAALRRLALEFPNFAEVARYVERQLVLAGRERRADRRAGSPPVIAIPPIVLDGPPGVGKSLFCRRLSEVLSVPMHRVQMETEQANGGLVGSQYFWANSRPGLIFETVVLGPVANAMILLDEVDKVNGDAHFDVGHALLGLLDEQQARAFCDKSVPFLPCDASHLLFLATSNDVRQLSAPLRSRLRTFNVAAPTPAQSATIARSIERSLRSRYRGFQMLDEDVLRRVAVLAPRQMHQVLHDALAAAAGAGRTRVVPADLILPDLPQRRLGFI